jgi:hypothetical protein
MFRREQASLSRLDIDVLSAYPAYLHIWGADREELHCDKLTDMGAYAVVCKSWFVFLILAESRRAGLTAHHRAS